jgi:uncharacterized membrane protein YfcA
MLENYTVFGSWPELAVAGVIMLASEAVYVTFGFGAGLIAVGFLALILDQARDVVVLLMLVCLPVELAVVFASRKLIRWRGVLLVSAGIGIGIPPGAWFLKQGETGLILVLLGAFLVLVGLAFVVMPQRGALKWPAWTASPVGVISGFLAGVFGTGGPPLVFYYRLQGLGKTSFRANLMAIFLVITAIRLPCYLVWDLITLPRLASAAAVLPAAALGALLGRRIHLGLSEPAFRRMVGAALVVLGLLLLVR